MNGEVNIAIGFVIEGTINTSTSTEDSSTSETDSNTNSLSVNTFSSEEDDGDLMLFPLMRYLCSGHKRNKVENYLHIVDSWSDFEFKKHLRVERILAISLIGNIYLKKI